MHLIENSSTDGAEDLHHRFHWARSIKGRITMIGRFFWANREIKFPVARFPFPVL